MQPSSSHDVAPRIVSRRWLDLVHPDDLAAAFLGRASNHRIDKPVEAPRLRQLAHKYASASSSMS
jgi:hypothetical protein